LTHVPGRANTSAMNTVVPRPFACCSTLAASLLVAACGSQMNQVANTTGGVASLGGATPSGGLSEGGKSGSGGAVVGGGAGGSAGRSATGGTNAGGASGTGGGTSTGAKRLGGACQAGASYPAPAFTGSPKLLYKPTGTVESGTYEGPVWVAANSVLLLSDISFSGAINPSQMLKLAPPSSVTTFLADAGVNGMAVDGNGVVFACSHKVQGIVKLDYAAGTLSTVVDNVGGKKFNSPNDLVLRSDGTIYFTDPDFQLGTGRTSATGKKGVYRLSPTGSVSTVDDTFTEPNGITLSPDESVLYVADYNGGVIRSFAVAADGSTSGRKDFATVSSPDGFAMDCLGNLYVASGQPGAIVVYSPSASKLASVTVAASISNMAFGGSDGKTLYITAGKALYSLDMNLPGYYY
jgi:sugar lactone lactonase YvrE